MHIGSFLWGNCEIKQVLTSYCRHSLNISISDIFNLLKYEATEDSEIFSELPQNL
jgi:hypothetical protein